MNPTTKTVENAKPLTPAAPIPPAAPAVPPERRKPFERTVMFERNRQDMGDFAFYNAQRVALRPAEGLRAAWAEEGQVGYYRMLGYEYVRANECELLGWGQLHARDKSFAVGAIEEDVHGYAYQRFGRESHFLMWCYQSEYEQREKTWNNAVMQTASPLKEASTEEVDLHKAVEDGQIRVTDEKFVVEQ